MSSNIKKAEQEFMEVYAILMSEREMSAKELKRKYPQLVTRLFELGYALLKAKRIHGMGLTEDMIQILQDVMWRKMFVERDGMMENPLAYLEISARNTLFFTLRSHKPEALAYEKTISIDDDDEHFAELPALSDTEAEACGNLMLPIYLQPMRKLNLWRSAVFFSEYLGIGSAEFAREICSSSDSDAYLKAVIVKAASTLGVNELTLYDASKSYKLMQPTDVSAVQKKVCESKMRVKDLLKKHYLDITGDTKQM